MLAAFAEVAMPEQTGGDGARTVPVPTTGSAYRAGFDFLMQRVDEIGQRLGPEGAFAAMGDRDGAGFRFFAADYQHVWDFLHLGVADFRRELFVAVVEMHAHVVTFEGFGDVLGVVDHFFANRANFDLHGRQPYRERAGVMLDQDAEEALDGSEQGAMDHQGLMAGAVFADIFKGKTRGKIEIELNGGELPGTADGVDELDVDLGAVEGGFPYDLL